MIIKDDIEAIICKITDGIQEACQPGRVVVCEILNGKVAIAYAAIEAIWRIYLQCTGSRIRTCRRLAVAMPTNRVSTEDLCLSACLIRRSPDAGQHSRAMVQGMPCRSREQQFGDQAHG